MHKMFLAHPRTVGESYLQHARVASGFAFALLGAGLAALVHALIPCLFEKTASNRIRELHAILSKRGAEPPRG
jgi:hypothetical protein